MKKILCKIILIILVLALGMNSPAWAGSNTAHGYFYKPSYGDHGPVAYILYNAALDATDAVIHTLVSSVSSLGTLVANWALTENYHVVFTGAVYSDGTTFTLSGDQTAKITTGKLIWADLGATDGVKASTVSTATYAAPNTTVMLDDSILTNNLRAVSVVMSRNGIFPTSIGWIFGQDYGNPGQAALNAGLAVIGINERTLSLGPGTWTINADTNIPTNVNLKPERGAILAIATAKTLTINGGLEAGLYQVFSCTGTGKVVFTEPGNIQMSWFNDDLAKTVASAPAGATILAEAKTYAVTSSLSISTANLTIKGVKGKTVFVWATLGTNISGITVTANGFTLEGVYLQGPTVAAYVLGERLLNMQGTSTTVRLDGLTVRDCEFSQVGSSGLRAQFVNHILVENNYFHNVGYIGAGFLSCDKGTFRNNRIKTITPGTETNMYGVTLTHDNTDYDLDPNAGTPLAVNPFCNGWKVICNNIDDINWQGIDTHGCYNVSANFNHIYACKSGLSLTTGSGDAINYAGWQNEAIGNIIDASNRDGTVSGRENTGYGMTLRGGDVVPHSRFIVTGNIIRGYGIIGNKANGAVFISAGFNKAIITNNVIENWGGAGISNHSAIGVNESNNIFGDMASKLTALGGSETAGYCIYAHGALTKGLTITGNTHAYLTNQAAYGVYLEAAIVNRVSVSANNFTEVYTGAVVSVGVISQQVSGLDMVPAIYITGVTGSMEIDLATYGLSNSSSPLILIKCGSLTGHISITNILHSKGYQQVLIANEDTTYNVTFTRNNAMLQGGVPWVGDRYDNLLIMRFAGVIYWHEVCRSGDNS